MDARADEAGVAPARLLRLAARALERPRTLRADSDRPASARPTPFWAVAALTGTGPQPCWQVSLVGKPGPLDTPTQALSTQRYLSEGLGPSTHPAGLDHTIS
eukprot:SAG25_NODE_21_length_22373_cov_13.904373_5_plen_102_part_00